MRAWMDDAAPPPATACTPWRGASRVVDTIECSRARGSAGPASASSLVCVCVGGGGDTWAGLASATQQARYRLLAACQSRVQASPSPSLLPFTIQVPYACTKACTMRFLIFLYIYRIYTRTRRRAAPFLASISDRLDTSPTLLSWWG